MQPSPSERGIWGVPMAMGILMIIGGVVAFFAAVLTSLFSVFFLGALLLVVGVFEIVAAFRTRKNGGQFVVYFLTGVLSIVVGGLAFDRPIATLGALTLLLAALFFAGGLFRGITAIAERYPHWPWDLGYGVIAIVLGIYVIADFPFSALWVLGVLVAAENFARGIALVAASTELHHRLAPAH